MNLTKTLLAPQVASISPEEAFARLKADPRVIIVDVRQAVETRSGTVPGAALIPLTEFGRRLGELPRDQPVLTICRSSHRSPIAARMLARAGYDVTDVSGGVVAWQRAGLPLTLPERGTGAQ